LLSWSPRSRRWKAKYELACDIRRDGKTVVKRISETTSPGVTQTPCLLTPEEAADLDVSLAEAAQDEFATDEEVRAVWAKHEL
jgi:hypothetical protein